MNIQNISIDLIDPHPDNPRKDLGDLTELVNSIKESGIFQNLTVVRNGERYICIMGHRRLAASKLAGLKELPCAVVEMDYKTQLSNMLVENMQRSDLTLLEEAQGIQLMFPSFAYIRHYYYACNRHPPYKCGYEYCRYFPHLFLMGCDICSVEI